MTTPDARVLSIRQPWAELILGHGKDIENRTWTTTWRELVVIHAGRRPDRAGAEAAREHGVPQTGPLPTGYLGVVALVDVHLDTGCCRPWGQPDTYHWRLAAPRRFPVPIAAPGRLGLHRPYPPYATHLHRLVTELTQGGDRV